MRFALGLSACLLVLGAAACQRAAEPVRLGHWRAEAALPAGALPFGLEFARGEDGALQAFLLNGPERVAIDELRLAAGELAMEMPGYNNRIAARVSSDGAALTGSLTLSKRGGELQVMPFVAQHGVDHRFFADSDPAPGDVAGRWAVTFTEPDGSEYPGVGEFRQSGARVTGTFLTPTGDHRYLAGEVHAARLYLSAFDGAHAYLHLAELGTDGRLRGDFYSGTKWHETWVAVRDAAAALPDPHTLTLLEREDERFDFTFPGLDGVPVSLSDPRFAGKVVVVLLGGSWCPNCHDEAAFMAPFYRAHREAGLEVIGLMFEHLDEFERAAATTRLFQSKFAIDYPLLIAGSSDKDRASAALPMLNRVLAFPTTIVVDRAGRVRLIHTGFTGPGTGEHYQRFAREFTAFIASLLAEPAPAAAS